MIDIQRSGWRNFALLLSIAAPLSLVSCARTGTNGNSNTNSAQGGAPTPTSERQPEVQNAANREPSLVALSAGAFVVKRPQEWMDDESAFHLLDEGPRSKWATPRGVTSPQTIVIALTEKTLLKTEQLSKDLEEFGRARVYGINFDSDSDHIKDESKPTLDKIVSILKTKPDLKITIEGHTDSTSTPEHNQNLSERRAVSVKTYLQSAGIESSRLKAAGYGATRPVASNDNELGRAQNRRVELARL